jgi:NAD(P)-dependent dehydrogenase (short-subunit alcohol dehydrogenase family)
MASQYWDQKHADACGQFRYEFPLNTLRQKTVVVAGGSGGLGAATVALLAAEGADLVVGYRANRVRAENLRRAMLERFHSNISFVEGDLVAPGVIAGYLAAIRKSGSQFAGAVIFPGDPARVAFDDLNRETLAGSFESNCAGPVLLAKALGESMEREKNDGSIVFLSTMQAVGVFPSSLNYAAPKAALIHAARILAQQWNHMRVNVVAPGATTAGMAATSIQGGKYDRYVANNSIARFGRPEDVARAVRFFLEPDNYVTGQVITVDGGLTLRRDRGQY